MCVAISKTSCTCITQLPVHDTLAKNNNNNNRDQNYSHEGLDHKCHTSKLMLPLRPNNAFCTKSVSINKCVKRKERKKEKEKKKKKRNINNTLYCKHVRHGIHATNKLITFLITHTHTQRALVRVHACTQECTQRQNMHTHTHTHYYACTHTGLSYVGHLISNAR